MAKKVNINTKKIKIKDYTNLCKGYGYDKFKPPENENGDHSSLYIEIDGVPYISEPTWAAGFTTENETFVQRFQLNYFLIPIYRTLNDHYPTDESKELLKLDVSLNDFTKAAKLSTFDLDFKTESSPFAKIRCRTGFLTQTYSCKGPIESIIINVYKLNRFNKKVKIDDARISSYEILQKKIPNHPERCRFRTFFSFPEKGTYFVDIFINTDLAVDFYVENMKKSSTSVPLFDNSFNDKKFIPIWPKKIQTKIENGFVIIRFAVIKNHSKIVWHIHKLNKKNVFEHIGKENDMKYGRYISLLLPFDDERYEDQLAITFPSNEIYKVEVYLLNNTTYYTKYNEYFFDVNGVNPTNQTIVNPLSFVANDRKFIPFQVEPLCEYKNVEIKPNQNNFYVNEKEQSIQIKTESLNDVIIFNLRINKNDTVGFPEKVKQVGNFGVYNWSFPNGFGEYFLEGWINKKYCLHLTYVYSDTKLNKSSENENRLMKELKEKIDKEKNDK